MQPRLEVAEAHVVPQGRIELGAVDTAATEVWLGGGVVTGDLWVDPAGVPDSLAVFLDNPIAQKRVRIRSVTSGDHISVSEAIVQVNRSGSIAINSCH